MNNTPMVNAIQTTSMLKLSEKSKAAGKDVDVTLYLQNLE